MMKSTRRMLSASAAFAVALSLLGMAAPAAWASNANHGKTPNHKAADHQGSASSHAHGNASTRGSYNHPQPYSHADLGGHGANPGSPSNPNPYRSTRNGSPSLNGNGIGQATGKPCAGCVGRADNKNPNGQQPGGSDHNNGYECDGNHGIGRTNPAHTGCAPTVPFSTPPPPPGGTTTTTTVPGPPAAKTTGAVLVSRGTPAGYKETAASPAVPAPASWLGALPFTGLPALGIAFVGLILVALGALLTVSARRRQADRLVARPNPTD
jgi:hypothetical protein